MTPKQSLFVQHYLIHLNATQAAKDAGYSPKTAYSMGQRLLKNVEIQKALQEANEERSKKTGITRERVLEALGQVAFGDIRALYSEGGNLLPIPQLPDDAAVLLAGFDVSVIKARDDGDEDEMVKKVKLVDRLRALEMIGRHLGMFNDKLEVSGNVGLADRINKARERVKKHRGTD